MAPRRRLDLEMVRRQLVPSREAANQEIVGNNVLVSGSVASKPSRMVSPSEPIELVGPGPQFVSRAGDKLSSALDVFTIPVTSLNCLDSGSSTGGFTDCLLQRGASRVVAVDVGTNQLHERIRANTKVVSLEKTDVRNLDPTQIGAPFDLIVGDLSFISLRSVLPSLVSLTRADTDMVLLIKPQFEARHNEVSKGAGVISDPAIWKRVIAEVSEASARLDSPMIDLSTSPVKGSAGNVEFTGHFRRDAEPRFDLESTFDRLLEAMTQ